MATPPLTRSIGSAERAMRALLARELAREGLSFPQWTALALSAAAPVPLQRIVQQQLAGHVASDASEAQKAITELITVGILMETDGRLLQHSEKGREVFERVSNAIGQISNSLYGDLPESDLDATHRTLLVVAARAADLLGAQ